MAPELALLASGVSAPEDIYLVPSSLLVEVRMTLKPALPLLTGGFPIL